METVAVVLMVAGAALLGKSSTFYDRGEKRVAFSMVAAGVVVFILGIAVISIINNARF